MRIPGLSRLAALAVLTTVTGLRAEEVRYSDVPPTHWAYAAVVAVAPTRILELPYREQEAPAPPRRRPPAATRRPEVRR